MSAVEMSGTSDKGVSGPFLGVSASAGGNRWVDRLVPSRVHIALAIAQQHNVPEVLGRMLASRLGDDIDVGVYLDPSIKNLMPDPHSLQDMEKAAMRIAQAMTGQQPIVIYGDYDVDGGTSSALWKRFLAAHGLDCRIYIPDRMTEGYGPNAAAMQQLVADGAKLIITVDCGSTSHEAMQAVADSDCDVIIIDHHQLGEDFPPCYALVNPNRPDDLSGQGDLAAAGVVFLTLVAVLKELRKQGYYNDNRKAPDLLQLLDLVALATICDVVPLTGLNRAYVHKGLQVMHHRQNAGLRALADVAGLQEAPNAYHLGFLLGPRINAGGRIGNASLGAQLLSSDDDVEAQKIAEQLDRYNSERKAMEGVMLEEAVAAADQLIEKDPDTPIIITGSNDWHKGLVGLLASRLVDRFKRPALAIAWEGGGEGTGSARSVQGVDIGGAIRAAVDKGLLLKGGGHAMAGGLTLFESKYGEVRTFLRSALKEACEQAGSSSDLLIDGALTPRAANEELLHRLEMAGPYGSSNPPPRFVFPAHHVNFAKIVGNGHVRCSLQAGDGSRLDAVAFRCADTPIGELLLNNAGLPLHIAGSLKLNSWGGRTKVEMIIDDVADPRKNR
ncbi:MAG: single-stranded-DNA-specific exonuclease RecJ [Hyphomicrobiaceae bacterium]|nr:single-stranded-DNA-specific exonuclease RecJ [Hyphomicrobiaceae bacterium]